MAQTVSSIPARCRQSSSGGPALQRSRRTQARSVRVERRSGRCLRSFGILCGVNYRESPWSRGDELTEIARTTLLGVRLRALVASMAVFSAACASRAATCESLSTLALPDTTIVLAKLEPAGAELHLPGTGLGSLPAFCRVAGEIRPTKDSNIKFEMWMPASGWNHKLMGIGNGGWSGNIWYLDMSDALQRGYAAASTDTGHEGSPVDASFALGHPEKVIDFGYRAFHETTVKATAIVSAYYGDAPKHSYWNGCSTGGKQGLTEAQRYPRDFDGIIAGAPANFSR